MDRNKLTVIWTKMHMIISPGEYGLGSEPESYSNDHYAAWRRLGELMNELSEEISKED